MSLYNLVCGTDPAAGLLLTLLELSPAAIPRFRDCYLNVDHIEVLTRTGGGNREHYETEADYLTSHPLYLGDKDDTYDSTFAIYRFGFPAEYAELLETMGKVLGPAPSLAERFETGLKNLSEDKLDYFRQLFAQLEKALK